MHPNGEVGKLNFKENNIHNYERPSKNTTEPGPEFKNHN